MKKIYLDQIDKKFDKKKDLVLGPWCFENKLNFFQICDLEKKNKILKKGNHSKTSLIKLREHIYKKNIKNVINYLDKINKNKFPSIIYKDMSNKWFLSFISLTIFAQDLIDQCLKKYKKK